MSCGDYTSFVDYWANGQFLDAVTCPYIDVVGALAFPLLIFGALAISYRIFSDSMAIPLVLGIIFAGVFITQLPPAAVQFATIVMLLAFVAAGTLVARRLQS